MPVAEDVDERVGAVVQVFELEPDVLVCGPSFGSGRYGYACGVLVRNIPGWLVHQFSGSSTITSPPPSPINAAHAINKGSSTDNQISITADYEAGQVVIRVKDTGCGIPESALERVFAPYYTTKAQGLGTGLGLPICREIVLQHKGKLSVTSEVDVGTMFTLHLPVSAGIDTVMIEDAKIGDSMS